MASPRCQSRDSSSGGRCPSDESVYSGRGGLAGQSGLSPVALTLPPTLPPGALLPQHSAAMAAYLNVAAAAAAQQNRLLLASPLRHTLHRERSASPIDNDDPILDYSKKRKSSCDQSDSNDENNSDNDEVMKADSSPLDLSVSSRKRVTTRDESPHHSPRKMPRPGHDYKPSIVAPWSTPVAAQLPFFANAVAAAGLSPKTLAAEWNGKNKHHSALPSDATKALEKMSELSRIGDEMFRTVSNSNNHNNNNNSNSSNNNSSSGNHSSGNIGSTSSSSAGRHSAWQSHWLNKGADTAKDVLKCVWCKQSFPSLAAMTAHMKETKHCGVSVPPQTNTHQSSQSQQSHSQGASSNTHNSSSSSSKSELNLLIKETMPLPRKLVRGQDVWLGKGAEQTRQILKCMWCGQSFRSLAEMTNHMQQTQHYTNIISQEQIISWRSGGGGSGERGSSNSGGNNNSSGNGSGNESNSTEKTSGVSINNNNNNSSSNSNSNSNASASASATAAAAAAIAASANSHVSAVLTCKVCDQAFSSLKELSNHMVKNAHYKEHIMRSITESGSRRKQTREKRKKSLPVRKLLELERAQNGENVILNKPLRDISAGRITCEKCGDKIDTALFVDHIRQCIGSSSAMSPAQKLKSALLSNTIIPPDSVSPVNSRDGRKSISDSDMTSPNSIRQRSPVSSNSIDLSSKSTKEHNHISGGDNMTTTTTTTTTSSPSVLNAIEQLIEKSFDTRSRHGSANFPSVNQNSTALGSSILKRLGIDESVDYTKPLVDAQTMSLLRNYHHSQQSYLAAQFGRRERSGSESSSISERGSSRVDSLTPEKKYDMSSIHATLMRATPDNNNKVSVQNDSDDDKPLKIKKEVSEEGGDDKRINLKSPVAVRIKRETNAEEDEDDNNLRNSSSRESANQNSNETEDEDDKPLKLIKTAALMSNRSPRASPSSPVSDHQSVTARSTPNDTATVPAKKKVSGSGSGSLGALSSMFDNLGSGDKQSQAENGQGKRSRAHPLAALQKLCDKTENNPNTRSNSASLALSASPSSHAPQNNRASNNSMISFNWAINDGTGAGDDSNFKCAFCDTSFTSKGAYRHHLSKVHFINDDLIPDAVPLKANSKLPPPSRSPKSPISISPKSNVSVEMSRGNGLALLKKSPSPVGTQSSHNERHNKSDLSVATSSSSASSTTTTTVFDESPHSKFLKYTELAKQLSSKYV
jgi:teashirt